MYPATKDSPKGKVRSIQYFFLNILKFCFIPMDSIRRVERENSSFSSSSFFILVLQMQFVKITAVRHVRLIVVIFFYERKN